VQPDALRALWLNQVRLMYRLARCQRLVFPPGESRSIVRFARGLHTAGFAELHDGGEDGDTVITLTARGRAVLREAKGVQDGTLSEMRASR